MKNILIVSVVVLALLGSGCALFTPKAPQDEIILQLSVQSASGEVFKVHPNWKKSAMAIMAATDTAISINSIVDIGSAAAFIKAKIPMDKLMPPEQALAYTLVDTVMTNVQADLARRGVQNPSAQLVELTKVLGWVNDMAKI